MFDSRNDRIVWSAQTTEFRNGELQNQASNFARVLVKQIIRDSIVNQK